MNNIAIITSGGDVSGMNPALKHFVEIALANDLTPYFVYDGYDGLIDNNIKKATYQDVAGIMTKGGTIIGSARSKRFLEKKYRAIAKENLDNLKIDKLIVLGGDGSFRGLHKFYEEHKIVFCGIPATIDNDINKTEYCLGVDTALNIIRNAIDSIRDTASSFKRAFVIETMGRDCGYLAAVSHLTSGSELCVIPEYPIKLSAFTQNFKLQLQNGRRYFITIVAEGAKTQANEVANWFKNEIGIESRVTVLGHIQRGGNPSSYDRLMAYKFVSQAFENLVSKKIDESIICYTKEGFISHSIDEVTQEVKKLDNELLKYIQESSLKDLSQ